MEIRYAKLRIVAALGILVLAVALMHTSNRVGVLLACVAGALLTSKP
jgi:cell shape-determining protein MreD